MDILLRASSSYNIHIESGSLAKASEHFDLNRKVLVLTDSGVPLSYAQEMMKQCKKAYLFIIGEGEANKSLESYASVLSFMLDNGFSRKDCLVSVGGGVVGDLGGFVASTYMRGIDFYNCPTTLLSMVDSSVGGKTAIDFEGYKNMVGTFYQPKAVLIDPSVLSTLDKRQFSSGMAEAIKMAATFDEDLFSKLEKGEAELEEIIYKSVDAKRKVVEQDERESGLRKVLNFGHSIGHALESSSEGGLFHGEAVGLGMLVFSSPEARMRIKNVLSRYDLPTSWRYDISQVEQITRKDKKASDEYIDAVYCDSIGSFRITKTKIEDAMSLLKEADL